MKQHGSLLARRSLLYLLLLVAFGVRVWHLETVPPGWSDDELSNIFVISQKIFQGNYAVYYPDATGLEALYHVVSGLMLALFGFNAIGIRFLSAVLGTLTVPLTYQLGKTLFDRSAGLLAAAMLAVSFWSLIYSRVNLRHISLPVFVLLTFYFFWRAIDGAGSGRGQVRRASFALAGVFMGIGFYTYFASRGIPLIVLAFLFYVALFAREQRRRLPGALLTLGIAAILAVPLLLTLRQQTGADARIAEVAVPLTAARNGDFTVLRKHVAVTLSMFHADGDDESLYNIPHRPVFGPIGAAFFWGGAVIAAWNALQPLLRNWYSAAGPQGRPCQGQSSKRARTSAFLLAWWFAGITPGFLSVPPASLGHTIIAQPASYILAALPVSALATWVKKRTNHTLWPLLVGLVLFGSVAVRDLPDYFDAWPRRGYVRFLYHADTKAVVRYVQQHPDLRHFAISGLLAGPWDRLALQVDLANAGIRDAAPRWYHPQRAIFLELAGEPASLFNGYPDVEAVYQELYEPIVGVRAGDYQLAAVTATVPPSDSAICFNNGLCLLESRYDKATGQLDLTWQVRQPLALPERPLFSKPPPPGVYSGPRLLVFAHLLNADGQSLVVDDGLWVDPENLAVGDVFRQQHRLSAPPGTEATTVIFGLYDPATQERVRTEDDRDHLQLDLK